MTDVIKRAHELVQEFDGKITRGNWVGAYHGKTNLIMESYLPDGRSKLLTGFQDITAMCSAPEMLEVIKGLLGEVDFWRKRTISLIQRVVNPQIIVRVTSAKDYEKAFLEENRVCSDCLFPTRQALYDENRKPREENAGLQDRLEELEDFEEYIMSCLRKRMRGNDE